MSSFSSSSENRESEPRLNPYRKRMYDAFISSRRQSPCHSFISRLYDALKEAGVYVFVDDTKFTSRDLILSGGIEGSRVSIIVFTTDYADSTWCLQELVKIMECRRSKGQVVVPVFYEVDLSEVRHQTGHFGEALAFMERNSTNESEALSYRTALHEAAGISPRLVCTDSRKESESIKRIVKRVTYLLDSTDIFVAEHPVGVLSRVQDLIQMLDYQKADDIQLLGIWGMGGIGKTTIAKALYNKISCKFEISKFIPDIGDRFKGNNKGPLSTLENELLYWMGRKMISGTLLRKKIFLVLDNVRSSEELKVVFTPRKLFGPGSRIIITTRNKQPLCNIGVDHIYRVKEMDYNECVELFSCCAFRKATPERNFAGLVKHVVEYSDGLPLALVALASILIERSIEEWESVLDRHSFKRFPLQNVQEVLKISIDELEHHDKQIFLEVAYLSYFFVGMDRNDVIQVLDHSAEIGIRRLEDQSLVMFDEKNKLHMHPLLQDMGKEIYQKESSIKPQKMNDVFLSFRGKDTRSKFTSHLHASLENASICVFKDDDGLQRGKKVSISLLKAIDESKISIIILSKNYANSKWCLQELEDIMLCYRNKAQKVLPVFYHVDPSEVRNQVGKFGQAFKNLIKRIPVNKDKEQSWRNALCEVGCISGFVIRKSRNESEDVKNIVEQVTYMLDMKDLFVAKHPVGVEARVQEVIKLLKNQQSEGPLLLGIWGMGGIGKTTIAKAVYNKICRDFEGRCFLLNIREVWDQDNGGVHLQEQLLFAIHKTNKIKIQNIDFGKSILEKRLGQKRILLVLDDVDKLEQLNALAASQNWFCPRSIIIITTRDEHLLHSVDKLYTMQEMSDKESIELFSWHAFKEPCPTKEFAGLSREVIFYCGGLPLALEVLGSHLVKRGVNEWKSVLEKLKTIPNEHVQKKLKISFDGLSDDEERKIFLDIAFFFIGMTKNDAIDILSGCGLSAKIGINVLMQRSLVIVDTKNKLRMHDLLRDMGREIIRKSSPTMPEERSRLWHPKEVYDVLSKDMGTKAVEGLALNLPRMNPIRLKTEAFKNMKRLRLLQLAGVELDGDFNYLSTDLRWLCWHGCPSTYTTANFDQGNLVAIDLRYSNLQLVWKKSQMLEKLKILNLSHSQRLTQTPDFSNMPNLEKLILKDCPSLSSVSHTIGHLKQVLLINLKGCTSLRVLPRSIYKLKSLKTLILSGCVMIDKLEEDLEQMVSLTTLMADNTAITQVPYALTRLKSIGYISLCGFKGLLRHVLPSIIWSWTSPTTSLSPQMQTSVDLSCLVSLTLPNSSFHATSSIIRQLPNVQSLRLECGSQIQTTEDVALDTLNVTNSKELEAMATTSHVSNRDTSAIVDGRSQGDISGSKNPLNSILIQMGMNCPVTEILKGSISQKLTASGSVLRDCLLPGDNNPDWLTFNGEDSSVIFEVPQVIGRNLKAVILCIVYSSPDIITFEGLILKNLLIINHTKTTPYLYEGDTLTSLKDEDWQRLISNLEAGDKVQVVVVLGSGFIVKKTAVYLIYDEPIDQNIKQCQADAIVSGGYDVAANKNITVSGGDNMVVDNKNENDSSIDDIVADKNFTVYSDDMVADEKENDFDVDVAENKNFTGGNDLIVDKKENASGVDAVAANKNFTVATTSSAGDGMAADKKENVFDVGDVAVDDMNAIVSNDDDDIVADKEKCTSSVDDGAADKNFNISGGDNMVVDKKENASDVADVRDKNFTVSGADATPANNKNVIVSGTDKKLKLLDKLNCFKCYRAD